jgi:hypothetical protein
MRFLAHYELYRQIKDLPGNIVEVGVYRGVSLLSWAKFLEIFHAGDRTRRVYGFDNFAGFADLHEKDGPETERGNKQVGGWNAGPFRDELMQHIDMFHEDSFLPRAKRIVMTEGDIRLTAQKFADENPFCISTSIYTSRRSQRSRVLSAGGQRRPRRVRRIRLGRMARRKQSRRGIFRRQHARAAEVSVYVASGRVLH